MIIRLLALLATLALLAGCDRTEERATVPDAMPALWEIAGPDGATEGWLFGTVHALPPGTHWRSPLMDSLLGEADLLVVEVAGLDDPEMLSRTFAALAYDRPGPPLEQRIDPALRDRYAELVARAPVGGDRLDGMESWAAALTLGQAVRSGARVENGADRALLREFAGRRILELEGARTQLAIFDALPEAEQRALLAAVVTAGATAQGDMEDMVDAWQRGDLPALEAITGKGMLADPELREALLAGRNRRWAARIADLLEEQDRPMIAVGAGHVVGPDGLPALLGERGFTLRRVQ